MFQLKKYFIFSENSFRCTIHAIVTFPLFDVFIMLVIVASSISLAAEVKLGKYFENWDDVKLFSGSNQCWWRVEQVPGSAGLWFHLHLRNRGAAEDSWLWSGSPPWLLPQRNVELHGLDRGLLCHHILHHGHDVSLKNVFKNFNSLILVGVQEQRILELLNRWECWEFWDHWRPSREFLSWRLSLTVSSTHWRTCSTSSSFIFSSTSSSQSLLSSCSMESSSTAMMRVWRMVTLVRESSLCLVKLMEILLKWWKDCGGSIAFTMTMFQQLALHYSLSRLLKAGLCKLSILFFHNFISKSNFQRLTTIYGCNLWKPGAYTNLPYWDVHFLHCILHCFPIFLCQYFRGLDHHHISRTRRGRASRGRNRQKSGKNWRENLTFHEHFLCRNHALTLQ